MVWFAAHVVLTAVDGLTDDDVHADTAVILGSKVNEDGTPSPRLVARLERGHELHRDRRARTLIVSGGLGREGHEEADVMRDWLVAAGVPPEDVLVDREGNDTGATARNTFRLMEEHELHSIIVVSQYFHVSRTKLAFRKLGVRHVYGAHARHFELRDAYSLVREFFAYYAYLLRRPGLTSAQAVASPSAAGATRIAICITTFA